MANSINLIKPIINNIIEYPNNLHYAVIIGESPSKGARSPLLWNSVFTQMTLDIKMLPIDVDVENLLSVLNILKADPYFIGGSIAVPYKTSTALLLGYESLTSEADTIGSINCLYRDIDNRLLGTNTDGEAALKVLTDSLAGDISGLRILILGGGGTGRAVATYLARAIGSLGKLYIACLNNFPTSTQLKKMGSVESISWNKIDQYLKDVDVVVNCTTLGSTSQIDKSPLDLKQLNMLSSKSVVFDVVYQPQRTKLLSNAQDLGLRIIDGLSMNFEQAAISFNHAYSKNKIFPKLNLNRIKKLMYVAS